jgi:hypothetical protein
MHHRVKQKNLGISLPQVTDNNTPQPQDATGEYSL